MCVISLGGELFAIDSSASANGENPTVQSAASFYVPDTASDTKPPKGSGWASSEPGPWDPAASATGSITSAFR